MRSSERVHAKPKRCERLVFTCDYSLRVFDLSPKMAVPTRTSVAPSSTAIGKSFVIPMESCGSLRSNSFSYASRNSRRSEEHTSELQSHHDLVCRLLLEKKKNKSS